MKSFDNKKAKEIYNDPILGMNTVSKLFYWFLASSSTTDVNAVRA